MDNNGIFSSADIFMNEVNAMWEKHNFFITIPEGAASAVFYFKSANTNILLDDISICKITYK
jgi:hypothetical protein